MDKEINCLSDLFIEIGGLIKNYEHSVNINSIKKEKERLYSIGEITKIYPKLTKYILTKAVNSGMIPVTWIGNERHFYEADVEKFLKSKTQKDCIVNSSWRVND